MKKIDLGQTIAILANVGVIAGILFLAVELQQNNQILTSQASYAQFAIERERRNRYIENVGGITDALRKAQRGEQLTDTEEFQLDRLYEDILFSWRWQFMEVEAGRLPSDIIDIASVRGIWRTNQRLAEMLENSADRMGPEFVRFIEESVIDQAASP